MEEYKTESIAKYDSLKIIETNQVQQIEKLQKEIQDKEANYATLMESTDKTGAATAILQNSLEQLKQEKAALEE